MSGHTRSIPAQSQEKTESVHLLSLKCCTKQVPKGTQADQVARRHAPFCQPLHRVLAHTPPSHTQPLHTAIHAEKNTLQFMQTTLHTALVQKRCASSPLADPGPSWPCWLPLPEPCQAHKHFLRYFYQASSSTFLNPARHTSVFLSLTLIGLIVKARTQKLQGSFLLEV